MLAGCNGKSGADKTIAYTTCGRVRGYVQDSVIVFKGIPYASAERFMPAHVHEKWDSIMDCTEFGNIAPQPPLIQSTPYLPLDTAATMGEDCLNLNIWTSARNDNGKRPVMVWLHSGSFDYGSSHRFLTFDGCNLAGRDNVVVVTLNHRLNALGFLDLSAYGDKYAGSGNLGMTDILAALKWIKENIAAFGGNPDNVTLFGHGSGGVKVLTLMAMPSARGYYNKAIVQSGVLEGMSQEQEQARRVAELTIEEARASGPDQLASLPYDSLWQASKRAMARVAAEYAHYSQNPYIKFAPVIDGTVLPEPIFTDSCINVAPDIPVILGSTLSEMTTNRFLHEPRKDSLTDVHKLSSEELDKRLDARFGKQKDEVKLAFAMAHPDRPMCEALVIDTEVRSKVLRTANLLLKRGDAPVYVYLFKWISPLDNGYAMSFRSSELPFVFNNLDSAEFTRAAGDEAKRLARIMSRCWTSFAKSGNPNNSITPFWRRINQGDGHTMIFDRDVRLETYPDLRLLQLLEPETVRDIKFNNP